MSLVREPFPRQMALRRFLLPEFKQRFNFSRARQKTMKIYVGNLSFNTTEAQLRDLFAAHGTVTSAAVVTDRETGRARGFGFVEMSDDGQARAAMTALNGKNVDGRDLTVNEAKPRESSGNRGGGGNRW